MSEVTYPRMVYRVGTMVVLESGTYDFKIAESAEDGEGWHLDQYAAKDASETATATDAPPTREELEQKATELGIKFDGRTSDKKLSEAIADKLKA